MLFKEFKEKKQAARIMAFLQKKEKHTQKNTKILKAISYLWIIAFLEKGNQTLAKSKG
jgi:hypothetical protein